MYELAVLRCIVISVSSNVSNVLHHAIHYYNTAV